MVFAQHVRNQCTEGGSPSHPGGAASAHIPAFKSRSAVLATHEEEIETVVPLRCGFIRGELLLRGAPGRPRLLRGGGGRSRRGHDRRCVAELTNHGTQHLRREVTHLDRHVGAARRRDRARPRPARRSRRRARGYRRPRSSTRQYPARNSLASGNTERVHGVTGLAPSWHRHSSSKH